MIAEIQVEDESLARLEPQPGADGRLTFQNSLLALQCDLPPDQERENLENYVVNPQLEIRYEGPYNPQVESTYLEVINSMANGDHGRRLTLSPIRTEKNIPALYKAGFFDRPIPSENAGENTPSLVSELVDLPYYPAFEIDNGEVFNLNNSNILSYETSLDMEHNVVTYTFRWQDSQGRITSIQVRDFASATRRQLDCFEYTIKAENYSREIALKTGFDGRVDNGVLNKKTGERKVLLETVRKGQTDKSQIFYHAQTRNAKKQIAFASAVELSSNQKEVPNASVGVVEDPKRSDEIYHQVRFTAEQGKEYILRKVVSNVSEIDPGVDNPLETAINILPHPSIIPQLLQEQILHWENFWKFARIKINGDPNTEKELAFSILKEEQLANPFNPRVGIAAKGLDNIPGEAYNGHEFHDEKYNDRSQVRTNPEAVKQRLLKRYLTLEGAKRNAKRLGKAGARIGWEVTDTGDEECPKVVFDDHNNPIEILNGNHEIHNGAAMVKSFKDYLIATADESMIVPAVTVAVEVSRFYASWATFDPAIDRYRMKSVIGPDEYHEYRVENGELKPGVHDNTATNLRTIETFKTSIEWLKTYTHLKEQLGVSDEEISKWNEIGQKMNLLYDPHTKLFEQFEGYFDLQEVEIPEGVTAADSWQKRQGIHPSTTRIIKQPDRLDGLLNTFAGDDQAVFEANFDDEVKHCSRGSTLSDGDLVKAALRAGKDPDLVYAKYLQPALQIDIGRLIRDGRLAGEERSNGFGIHSAGLANSSNAIVEGYLGLSPKPDRLLMDPKLYSGWSSIDLYYPYLGQRLHILADHEAVRIDIPATPVPLDPPVEIAGNLHHLETGKSYHYSRAENKWTQLDSPEAA